MKVTTKPADLVFCSETFHLKQHIERLLCESLNHVDIGFATQQHVFIKISLGVQQQEHVP